MKKSIIAIIMVMVIVTVAWAVPITDTNGNGILSDGNFALRTSTVSTSNYTEGQATLAAGTLTLIAAANNNRATITIQNHGVNPVYCGFNPALTAANGPILLQQNGAYVFDRSKSALYCISTAGTTIGYLEQY